MKSTAELYYLFWQSTHPLAVTPDATFVSSGLAEGPFNPDGKTYTLTNNGAEAVDWTAETSENWLALNETSGTLGSGESKTVVATVNPPANAVAIGDYPGTVTFAVPSVGQIIERLATLAVSTPEIEVAQDGVFAGVSWPGEDVRDGLSTVVFREINPFIEAYKDFYISNIGRGTLTGVTVSIDGPDAAAFTLVAPPRSAVLPGGGTSFSVRFRSSSGGVKTAGLHIASSDTDEGSFDIALVGTVVDSRGHYANMGDSIPESEYKALVDLYNATGGAKWTRKTGWRNPAYGSWTGVVIRGVITNARGGVIQKGHVTQLHLGSRDFYTGSNNMVGALPESIGNLTELQYLHLNGNQLNGPLPNSIGNLAALKVLLLDHNQFVGSIPSSLGNLSALDYLSLDFNRLTGHIPDSLSNLNSSVGLSANRLTGAVPESLSFFTGRVNLADNQLSGRIPIIVLSPRINLASNFVTLDSQQRSEFTTASLYSLAAWNPQNPANISIEPAGPGLSINPLRWEAINMPGSGFVSLRVTNLQPDVAPLVVTLESQDDWLQVAEAGNPAEAVASADLAGAGDSGNSAIFRLLADVTSLGHGQHTSAVRVYHGGGVTEIPVKYTYAHHPDLQLEQPPGHRLNDADNVVSFGPVVLGSSADLSFALKNAGNATVSIQNATFEGRDREDFAVVEDPDSVVAPNTSASFTVRFAPSSAGAKTASLRIANTIGIVTNEVDINLTGFGLNDQSESGDTDRDGVADYLDEDDDNDGLADKEDALPLNPDESIDSDEDGIGDIADSDDDGDGISDAEDRFTVLRQFDYARDGGLASSLMLASNGYFYGTTYYGGNSDAGTLFRMNSDGTGYRVLKHFDLHTSGVSPTRLLEGRNSVLFGTAASGGPSDGGTVFRINPDGSGFSVLHNFLNTFAGDFPQGRYPFGGLIQGHDGALYGTTNGGGEGTGIVYKLNVDGSGFKVLQRFDPYLGVRSPSETGGVLFCKLVQGSNGSLYGTASTGGHDGGGTVFKLNPDGGGFQVLKHFDPLASGEWAAAGLVQDQNLTLYGTTAAGGKDGVGTIFKLRPDGSGFTTIKEFGGSLDELILDSHGVLYGASTSFYSFNSDGSNFRMLHDLDAPTEGSFPHALVEGPDGLLYGVAEQGGRGDSGTVFRLVPDGLRITRLAPTTFPSGAAPATLTVSGFGFKSGAVVEWDGQNLPTTFISNTRLKAITPLSPHTVDISTVLITVKESDGSTSLPAALSIAASDLTDVKSSVVDAGKSASVTTAPTLADQSDPTGTGNITGLSATLTNNGENQLMIVSTAVYNSAGSSRDAFTIARTQGIGVAGEPLDLKVSGADQNASMTAYFYYPANDVELDTTSALKFFNNSEWVDVLDSGGAPPGKEITDDLDGTLSGGRFTVTFDNQSTPKITELGGTIFTVVVPKQPFTDADGDSVVDELDVFPLDTAESLDADDDGVGDGADTDDDNDGVIDAQDTFQFDPNESADTDGDRIGNNADFDDDGDGVADGDDSFPMDPNEWSDSDGDGVGDNADSSGQPPTANAGVDRSANEEQLVMLDGSLSSDPDGDSLEYTWVQFGGTRVVLSDADSCNPTFRAPIVAHGGETLSFELTVTADGESSTDTVDVTIVNVNHTPVAEAGTDQSVAEGSLVSMNGELSFDVDSDFLTYAWVQVDGTPAVILSGADTAHPTFTTPYMGTNGAPGVVAKLDFELRVDDGYPQDQPAPGFTFANVMDRVTVNITNVNNSPMAKAGGDQTVVEHSAVGLSGIASSDPDGDSLTYAWTQVATGSPTVAIVGATTATPSFTAPFVSSGGASLEFELKVEDGYGGSATDRIVIHVKNANDPPLASAARPTITELWPPNHGLVTVGITGVSDPNNNATISITRVTQDEPTNGLGDGDTAIDAVISSDGTVRLRAERSGKGDGRVYRIYFTASDLEGSASGMVFVTVPHSAKKPAADSGGAFDSTR